MPEDPAFWANDHNLLCLVAKSNPEGPDEREAAAYEMLLMRGYTEQEIAYELEKIWKEGK